jgi:crossover junction endodeoxyribonuclease RuvC
LKYILGADPGMTGALALLDQHGNLMVTADIHGSDGRVDSGAIRDTLDLWKDQYGIDMGVVENVGSMPKQGVSTTFKFGRATGNLEGVIQGLFIPMALVTPAQWKSKLKMTGKAKDYPRQWCAQRWPTVEDFKPKLKGQARADAACLALAWLEMHPEFREASDRLTKLLTEPSVLEGGPPRVPSKRPPPRRALIP